MAEGGPRLETLQLEPNGNAPNSRFPVLIYRAAIKGEPDGDLTDVIEATFRRHNWLNNWREPAVYNYYHYHSTTHEVLGFARGHSDLRLGGEGGPEVRLSAGDVLVMPAGTSHIQIGESSDLFIVGGYPEGRSWDLVRDDQASAAETRDAILRIATLPIPDRDPVSGQAMELWRQAPRSYGIE
ncbi:hypothetical protein [Singulisphaera acidiphila]|uniref:Uncharacterized protein containing double-stranded beta helix domain n=1 Tax=Singulisphaera acidiphila (strain ATCC BAA-1392 / DSM 18658 / VKM B-2454 / MOB10) TaxID=886293 RepID=L0DQ87_SINAD|nr:hypothetical protein [Singulisphaera acidiphila]AGA31033.1 uncharacterized protein containing double-stranded beta helix domain [Singulisphaera acidiphila DSM 18658]